MKFGGVLATLILAAACTGSEEKEAQIRSALREALAGSGRPSFVTADAEGKRLWKQTRDFYDARGFAPAWIEGTAPGPQIEGLVAALRAAAADGLDPQLYNVALIEQEYERGSRGFLTKKGFEPHEAGTLDARLTYVYLKYASDLADGLSDLARADRRWQIRAEKFDPRKHLEDALAGPGVKDALRALLPGHEQYGALRRALADLRAIEAKGGWNTVPNVRLKPGQKSAAVPAIARRLAASGDYDKAPPAEGAAVTYGPDLVDAVKRFQRRHGLADDGRIGPDAVSRMNVPVAQRIAQVRLNLERWRWLPRDLGPRYILVNIPEYHLEVWEGGKVPLSMRVVVGKEDTPTPIFNDVMTYIVLSPYWNVPPDIAEGETLPAVLKDPGFLERQNMEVLDAKGTVVDPATIDLDDPEQYRFRQRPGAANSLGLVKFMFPNQFNVYLHDTPADSLFDRATRSFSHGCVRVEDPVALARYVLSDQPEWTDERLEEAMHAGEERHVKLKTPTPVYLGYWTARVSADGVLQLRNDIYGIDARQQRLLEDRLARLRKTAPPPTKDSRP